MLANAIWHSAISTLAQTDDITDLEPYVVKSYWFENNQRGNTSQILNHADLGKHHSSDLASVLQQATPDVGIIRKAGTSNDIIIRGLSQDNINVTIDDAKIFCACSNRMDPPISQISSSMLTTIELTQGAFDLKNSGSLGGSIKILTKPTSDEESWGVSAHYGSYDQANASIFATGGNQRLEGIFMAEYSHSDPYEDGSGKKLTEFPDSSTWPVDDYLPDHRNIRAYEAQHANAKLKWKLNPEAYFQAAYRFRKDKNMLYPGLRMDADLNRSQEFAITFEKDSQANIIKHLKAHVYHNETRHDMHDSHRLSSIKNAMNKSRPQYVLDRGWYMESLATASTSGIQLNIESAWDKFEMEWGGEYTRRIWDINNRLGAGMPNSGPGDEIFNDMIPDTESNTIGAYAQANYWLNDTSRIDFGIRLDWFETLTRDNKTLLLTQTGGNPSKREWMPSAKMVFRSDLNESFSWFAGVGTTARIANGQERYMQLIKPGTMPNWLGNPELKSPRNTEFALGFSHSHERFKVNGKAFYSLLEDYIYMGKAIPGEGNSLSKNTQTYFNIDAILYGFDVSIALGLTDHLAFYSGFSWQKGKKETFTPNNPSDKLGEVPPIKGMSSIRYVKPNHEFSFECQYADKQESIDPFIGEETLDAYAVFNIRGRFRLSKNLTTSFGVENLLDHTYAVHNAVLRNPFSNFTIVNEPGRMIYLNIEYLW